MQEHVSSGEDKTKLLTHPIFKEPDHLLEHGFMGADGLHVTLAEKLSPQDNIPVADQVYGPVLTNTAGYIALLHAAPKSRNPLPSQLQQLLVVEGVVVGVVLTVIVGVVVWVTVGVGVTVLVGVGVFVGVGVLVIVFVGVAVGVLLAVFVGVKVAVGVTVGVMVGVKVAVGILS